MNEQAFNALLRAGTVAEIRAALTSAPELARARDVEIGNFALEIAVSARNEAEVVEALLEAGCPVDAHGEMTTTPAFAFVRSVGVAEVLDRYGAKWAEHGDAALSLACRRRDEATASWLLAHGARPGVSALRQAAESAKQMFETLASAAAPEVRDAALVEACANGDLQALNVLLAHGGDARQPSALEKAAGLGEVEIVRTLLDHRASPNEPDAYGERPLISACFEGHTECVALLLERGADPALANHHGQTPLDLSRQPGREWLAAMIEATRR